MPCAELDTCQVGNAFRFSAFVTDDLDVSVDFFEYFLATYPLLKEDPTLWCVSAWNDNGKESRISRDAGNFSPRGLTRARGEERRKKSNINFIARGILH